MNRWARWWVIALLGSIPVVVSVVHGLMGGAILLQDRAVFGLLVADAATGSFPSLGQYSWHGWSHLGSLLFYIFVPFHWLAGGASWGLFVGAGAYSCALLVLIAWLAFRLRGLWGSATAVALLLASWMSVGGIASADVWTPFLAIPLFVLFVTAAWGVTERDRPSMWLMCMSAALVVQVHVGYLPIVGLIGLTALGTFWWTGGNQRAIARPILSSLLLFLPLAFNPRDSAANFVHLWRFFSHSDTPTIGLSRGLRVVAFEMSPEASWLQGPSSEGIVGEARNGSWGWFAGVVIILLLCTIWVFRSPAESPRRRFGSSVPIMWAGLVAMVIGVAQVRGYLIPYVVLWRAVIVMLIVVWIVGVILANTSMVRQPLITAGAMGLFVLNLIGAILPATEVSTVKPDAVRVREAITQAVVSQQNSPSADEGAILFRLGDGGLVGLYPALLYDFEQRGIAGGIPADVEWVFGDRVLDPVDASSVWMVCDTGWAFSLLSSASGATIVSVITPFTPEEEAKVVELQTLLARELRTLGHSEAVTSLDSPLVALSLSELDINHEAAQELATLNQRASTPGVRFGIVAFAPSDVPDIWWPLEVF